MIIAALMLRRFRLLVLDASRLEPGALRRRVLQLQAFSVLIEDPLRRNPSSGVEGLGISSRADVDWRAELTLLHARRTAIRDSHALTSGII